MSNEMPKTIDGVVAMLRANARGERFDEFSFSSLADCIEAALKRDDTLHVPVYVWNEMASKVESVDTLRVAIDRLPDITETDARSIEHIAKYAMNHSMYGGGIIQAMTGAVREAKRALAKQRGGGV